MDFDDHDDDIEMGHIIPPPPGYESIPNNNNNNNRSSAAANPEARKQIRYRECLKNHAVGIGGHAVDGCGEFLSAGDDGSLDALKCAACSCHRNFHRKDPDNAAGGGGGAEPIYPPPPYYRPPAGYLHLTAPRLLALPAGHSRDEEDVSNPSSSGGGGGGSSGKKRFRTKFTAEQKERMAGFAERLGWRIQKHDEAAVEQFCGDTGVKRHVLKVWMHNNKHTLGKKQP